MVDKNEDYVTKSKLKTTVEAFSKKNDRSRVAAKETNKQTQSKHIGRKTKHILTNRHRGRLVVDKRT